MPDTTNSKTERQDAILDDTEFISVLTDLIPNTVYYVRAYAQTVTNVVAYGETIAIQIDKYYPNFVLPVIDLTQHIVDCTPMTISIDVPEAQVIKGDDTMLSYGYICSIHSIPTLSTSNVFEKNIVADPDDDGQIAVFDIVIPDLLLGTDFYIRPFAITADNAFMQETTYGNIIQ